MPNITLSIPDHIAEKVENAASKKRITEDKFILSAIERAIWEARHSAFATTMRFLVNAIVTAAFVVIIVVLLQEVFPPIPYGPIEIHPPLLNFLTWIADIIKSMFPWPATAILIAYYFFKSSSMHSAFFALFRLFRRIKIYGAEVELGEEAKRTLQTSASDIKVALADYRTKIDEEVQRLIDRHQIDRAFEQFVDKQIRLLCSPQRLDETFRCTLHISDPVQRGQLYQLLDYYPSSSRTTRGAARTFSERYGIIGKVWRSEKSQAVGNLSKGLSSTANEAEKLLHITEDWGMTREEARRALKRPSYACALICAANGEKLATLYMDSEVKFAFIPSDFGEKFNEKDAQSAHDQMDKLLESIRLCANKAIAPKIEKLISDISSVSPKIDLRKKYY